MLPQDPIILLSYVNTQLRDNYSSLDKLAEGLDLSEEEVKDIVAKLEGVGYKYDEEMNQFK
jgi:biotin operon repressor